MFNGYFTREYHEIGVSQVCCYDSGGVKIIQEYYRDEPKAGETRKLNCETVADPIGAGRGLVALLNGGKDFQALAKELKLIREALEGINESIQYLHPKS